jgi:hypothetical protein
MMGCIAGGLLKTKGDTPMNAEIKKLWLEALRSGKYSQGCGALRWEDKFCCFGVLCDLVDKTKWEAPTEDGFRLYANNINYPPDELLNKVGLPHSACISLSRCNDDCKSFAYIAQLIEERY